MVRVQALKHHSGPLPQAEQFAIYEDVVSGSGKKILAHMEKEQKHRQKMDMFCLDATKEDNSRGQWMGFAIVAITIGGALLSMFFGHVLIALAFLAPQFTKEIRKMLTSVKKKDE